MKIIIVFTLLVSSKVYGGTVIEDIIDFGSGVATWGHHLTVREMDEQQIALEIDKRLAQDLERITDQALRRRIEFLKDQLKSDIKERDRIVQLYDKTNQALRLAVQLRTTIENKLNNKAILSVNVQALLATTDVSQKSIELLSELYESSEAFSKDGNPAFLLYAENLNRLAEKYDLTTEELSQLLIELEEEESLNNLENKYFEQQFILGSFKTRLLTRKKQLDKRIEFKQNSLNELSGS